MRGTIKIKTTKVLSYFLTEYSLYSTETFTDDIYCIFLDDFALPCQKLNDDPTLMENYNSYSFGYTIIRFFSFQHFDFMCPVNEHHKSELTLFKTLRTTASFFLSQHLF